MNAYSEGVVSTGLAPQIKEFLYQDYNTLLLFEEDFRTRGQGFLRDDNGMQGRFIDIIQYETELITHVDMDFDCPYHNNEINEEEIQDTLENVVQDGRCYETY